MSQLWNSLIRDGITRRNALTAFLLAASSAAIPSATASSQLCGSSSDPALMAWKAWHSAHCHAVAMCRKQQRLETLLSRTVGFPQEPGIEAHQASWDAADRRVGYSAALRAEKAAFKREARLGRILFGAHASSLAGVIAKLDAIIAMEQPGPDDDQAPWPQLRRIHADFRRIVHMAEMPRSTVG